MSEIIVTPIVVSIHRGCHCELAPGENPDECVIDNGFPNDCVYAIKLLREGKTKTDCHEWKIING
ncbi:MAG TPA: hypothetical protein VIH30_06285 [Aquirhabdus sp.]